MEAAVVKALTLSILLWEDATPTATFPPLNELVSIETSRLLGDPRLIRTVPGLAAALETAGVGRMLQLNPWEISAKELLSSFSRAISEDSRALVRAFLEEEGYKDVCLDMIRYRQKTPTHSATQIEELARKVCEVVGIVAFENLIADITGTYDRTYRDLIRV